MKNSEFYKLLANIGLIVFLANKEFTSALIFFIGYMLVSLIYCYFE